MSVALIQVVDKNPNDQVGGGGCLCSGETKDPGCVGPYVVFAAVSTDSGISPHAVICRRGLTVAAQALGGEVGSATTDVLQGGLQGMVNENEKALGTRAKGIGPRDADYVPVDAEDAKLPRDDGPGANDPSVPADATVEPVLQIEKVAEGQIKREDLGGTPAQTTVERVNLAVAEDKPVLDKLAAGPDSNVAKVKDVKPADDGELKL